MKTWKQSAFFGIVVIIAVVFAVIACDNDNNETKIFTVTFNLDGGNIGGDTANVQRTVTSGGTVASMPANPSKADNTFGGWYTQQNGVGTEFTASIPVTTDITVYAKWEPANSNSPVANAGTHEPYTLSNTLSITLDGTASTNSAAFTWECTTYTPAQGVGHPYTEAAVTALIADANAEETTVALRKAGTYVFTLTVTGDNGGSDTDDVEVVVEGFPAEPKDVEVTFPAFVGGFTILSFAPIYTPADGWEDYLNASDITYTVICTELSRTYDSGTGFVASISDGYENSTTYTFTQTFKLGDTLVGEQTIKARVLSGYFINLMDASNTPLDPRAIPPISLLNLEKTVTEIPVLQTLWLDVTVPAITTVSNPMQFGTVASLSSWNSDFPATDVSYTLLLSRNGGTMIAVTSTSATSISVSNLPEGNDGVCTLTQTFFYKGAPIANGSRSVGIGIFGNIFTDMYVSETDYGPGSFPELTLHLEKTVTVGP